MLAAIFNQSSQLLGSVTATTEPFGKWLDKIRNYKLLNISALRKILSKVNKATIIDISIC